MKNVIGSEKERDNKMKHSSVDLLRNNAYSQFLVSSKYNEKLNIERKHSVAWQSRVVPTHTLFDHLFKQSVEGAVFSRSRLLRAATRENHFEGLVYWRQLAHKSNENVCAFSLFSPSILSYPIILIVLLMLHLISYRQQDQ